MRYTKSFLKSGFQSDIRLTFFRHGATKKYEEVGMGMDTETLTKEGRDQVLFSAAQLAQDIKRHNEISLVWTSPRKRTVQTGHMLVCTLRKYGTIVLGHRGSGEMFQVVDMLNSPNLTKEFWNMRPSGESFVSLWRELSRKGLLPQGVESYETHMGRVQDCIVYAKRIAEIRKKQKHCPRIHIVAVCHFETVTPILQVAYGEEVGVARTQGLANAEYISVCIQNREEENVHAIVRVDFTKGLPQDTGGSREVFLLFDGENNFVKIV